MFFIYYSANGLIDGCTAVQLMNDKLPQLLPSL